jgi:hypothetical protein
MKLKKDMVITSKSMSRNEIFSRLGYIEYIIQGKITCWSMNNSMPNLINSHTRATGCVDLIMSRYLSWVVSFSRSPVMCESCQEGGGVNRQ